MIMVMLMICSFGFEGLADDNHNQDDGSSGDGDDDAVFCLFNFARTF